MAGEIREHKMMRFPTMLLLAAGFAARASGEDLEPAPKTEARVLVVEDARATISFNPQAQRAHEMIMRGVLALTGKTSGREAWLSLVSTQDVVGIKVHSAPGAASGTRRCVVEGVVMGLMEAGLPANQIVVWDRRISDLRAAGYYDLTERFGVRVAGGAEEGFDDETFYETALVGNLVWGDHEFGKRGQGIGRKSFCNKIAAKTCTKLINITPLLNHNLAGICGHVLTLAFGSVDNTLRFELDPDRVASAAPEIYALPPLGDKVALNITDALIAQYQGEERSLLHYSAPLNQLWFSKDPVALDVLGIQELDRQRAAVNLAPPRQSLELYKNAELLELGVADSKRIHVERVSQ